MIYLWPYGYFSIHATEALDILFGRKIGTLGYSHTLACSTAEVLDKVLMVPSFLQNPVKSSSLMGTSALYVLFSGPNYSIL